MVKQSKSNHIPLDNKLLKGHNDLELIKNQIVECKQDLNILINLSTTSDGYGELHEQKRDIIVKLDLLNERLDELEFNGNVNAG